MQLKMSLTKAFQRSRRRGGRSKKAKTSSGRTPGGAWSDTESEAAASSVRSAAEEAALSAAALSMPNSPNVGPRQHHRRHPSSESVPHSTPVTPSVNEIRQLTTNSQQQQLQLPAPKKGSVELHMRQERCLDSTTVMCERIIQLKLAFSSIGTVLLLLFF